MKSILVCVYCHQLKKTKNSLAQHTIRCKFNPNAIVKSKGFSGKVPWNKGQTKETNTIIAGYAKTLKDSYSGPRGAAVMSFEERSIKAKQQGFGGYREKSGRSKKFVVTDSFDKRTVLQSSYELECSVILDSLGISWLRPTYLKYDDKKYFADFYLPDYNIWLDPKNNYKAKLDKEKIEKVVAQNKIKLYIITKEQLTQEWFTEFISSMAEQATDNRSTEVRFFYELPK